jgi:vacuolar protein sorting-associated protein VTA1
MSTPPIPPTELIDAPTTHISHELDGAYSTSPALPLESTAFGESDAPLEIDPGSAPISIDPSDAHAQHDLLDGPPEVPPLPTLSHGSPTDPVPITHIGQGQEHGSPASIIDASPPPSPTRTHCSASPTHFLSPSSPPPTSYIAENLYPSAPPLPPPPSVPYVRMPPPAPSPLEPSPPAELTPGLIAKAQKHSRFAISALDYEDVEQARKELRAALAILGG